MKDQKTYQDVVFSHIADFLMFALVFVSKALGLKLCFDVLETFLVDFLLAGFRALWIFCGWGHRRLRRPMDFLWLNVSTHGFSVAECVDPRIFSGFSAGKCGNAVEMPWAGCGNAVEMPWAPKSQRIF